MLGKLFKHEWKQTWKLPAFTCLATILVTIIGMIAFHTPLWDADAPFWLNMIGGMLLFMNIFLLIASSLTILVYFSIRFYKNLYTDEGYLMHTLPATSRQLISSKFWVFFLWIFISGALISICFTALMLSADEPLGLGFMDLVRELRDLFSQYGFSAFFEELNAVSLNFTGLPVWVMAIFWLILVFVGFCHTILTPYFSISVGQLFSKFKLGASIGIYIAILILQQLLTTAILLPVNMSVMFDVAESTEYHVWYFYALYGPQYLLVLGLTALFYFFTHKIMKKHLNLD